MQNNPYQYIYSPLAKLKIKGLGPKTMERLELIGVVTLYDLLYHIPRGYEDKGNLKRIIDLTPKEYAVVKGTLRSSSTIKLGYRKVMTKALLEDSSGIVELVWFNMPYIKNSLKEGQTYTAMGKVGGKYRTQIMTPELKQADEEVNCDGGIEAIYSLGAGISAKVFQKLLRNAFEKYSVLFEDNIPECIRKEHKLLSRVEALKKLHWPKTERDIEEAKYRFAVEELLILQMGIAEKRYLTYIASGKNYELADEKKLVKRYLDSLAFELTKDQKKVIKEIYQELKSGIIVHRLLQGDVGSGKTIVALVILLYIIENGHQGVLMAPTEILATQHYLSNYEDFEKLGVRMELLTGGIKGKKREKLLADIKTGAVDLVIGTHALIEEEVEFKNLGLTIIDEQHRFGVEQRLKLRNKSTISNLLVMSATPIPRSLALSIYGDLDVSLIKELPPGRQPIKTKWLQNKLDIKKAYEFIKGQLVKGRQAYFVAPLIEASEVMAAKSIDTLYSELECEFSEFKIKILHGRMKNKEKDQVMHEFKSHQFDILVSTTVVEVGVNVPNASVMVISSAERFGLSSLHQLRGRIGRGEHKSYCFLESSSTNELTGARLEILEKTIDGFKIAEEDLRLRKPGEIFGKRQSGLSDLKFVDIIHDFKTIRLVHELSKEYLLKNNGEILNEALKEDIRIKLRDKNENDGE